jgi:hypothetical protein
VFPTTAANSPDLGGYIGLFYAPYLEGDGAGNGAYVTCGALFGGMERMLHVGRYFGEWSVCYMRGVIWGDGAYVTCGALFGGMERMLHVGVIWGDGAYVTCVRYLGDGAYVTCGRYFGDGSILQRFQCHKTVQLEWWAEKL